MGSNRRHYNYNYYYRQAFSARLEQQTESNGGWRTNGARSWYRRSGHVGQRTEPCGTPFGVYRKHTNINITDFIIAAIKRACLH